MNQQAEKLKTSEALYIAGRVWLFLALAAMMLAIVVQAIEQQKSSVLVVGYRVPIEREEETNVGNSG